MQRAYLVLGALLVGLFSYGQYNYWSLYGSDAGAQGAEPALVELDRNPRQVTLQLSTPTEAQRR